ncbi:hypothetical protein QBC40DRAFT_181679 [Triangularia verruculosa]|uniref:Uncharacterized protein n=1 Tax=Triangularia verruculosa TaxID=2587418 RepID=A0AAN6XCZ2_9PEZI|nr:hypothetical protein QBC40DRAFT_181679 [Triangularia verruculosa]
MNAVLAAPPAVHTGPHWPLPTHMINCDPTYARHNVYAYAWAVVRIQIEWIREDGPKFWYLRAGTPSGHVVRVGCCHEAAIVLVAQGRDANGSPAPLQRDIAVSSAEITTMALAVTDGCRADHDRTKGRAWAKNKEFTVEVFYDDYKCDDRCWQGD